MNLVRSLICLIFGVGLAWAGQQQQQAPPGTPPPQPPPGAANGPHPGPAVKAPGPGERTSEAKQQAGPASANVQEAMRNFLAIGAPPDPEAVKRGQALFVGTCGFCHGTNATGGNGGPDLVRSVLVLHDQGTGKEIGPVIKNGRPAKGMPSFSNLTDAQIKDIAAFLLERTQAAANRMSYKILNIVTGDPKAGEAYFNVHCASCHSATGDLAHIAGKFDPVALQSRFLYPRTERWPGAPGPPPDPRAEKTVTVKLPSGQTYEGTLDRIDDFSVSLTDSSGQHHTWLFDEEKGMDVDVHDPLKTHAELLRQYTDADMHNILAYLETLK
ncbi:MAG TPA: c-type cytochrome [Bryobacteraceae bacterium]|nr:c-type cytochrome [Bryobacteraceae bacterium]